VGREDEVRQRAQPARRRRLALEDVERRGAQAPGHERLHEGVLVDEAAARGVDEDRARAHAGERGGVEQRRRVRRQRRVERHDVAALQ
jgi:hypothetical protein